MTTTIGIRLIGPTSTIAVTTTASTPLLITPKGNDVVNYAEFTNTGTASAYIRISNSAENAVHPVAGTPGDYILKGTTSAILAVPTQPYYVSAITITGTTTLYVTPVDSQ
jgi:hypothetical protein